MAAGYSTAAVSMGHLALKRTIRHAEANDLISRNVANLADTPKGPEGRSSRSLALNQAAAVITAVRTLPIMELRPGLKTSAARRTHARLYRWPGSAPKKPAPCTGSMSTWTAAPPPARPSRRK